jgi:hypothetical protein
MLEYTLHLPENNSSAKALLAYIKTLDFAKLTPSKGKDEINIPAWQVKEVTRRMKTYKNNPETALDFDQVMNDIEKEL